MLRHYVDIDSAVPTRHASTEWFVGNLPHSVPTFRAPTFAASIEFTADGLATSHVLRSLIPELSQNVLQNVKLFDIDTPGRRVVLAMRKHLLSHPTFARFYQQVIEFCRTDYGPSMQNQMIRSLSDLLVERPPGDISGKNSRPRGCRSEGVARAGVLGASAALEVKVLRGARL